MSTIRDFESGKRVPIANNLEALRRAFDDAGVRLLFDGDRPAGIAVPASGATAVESEMNQGTGAHA